MSLLLSAAEFRPDAEEQAYQRKKRKQMLASAASAKRPKFPPRTFSAAGSGADAVDMQKLQAVRAEAFATRRQPNNDDSDTEEEEDYGAAFRGVDPPQPSASPAAATDTPASVPAPAPIDPRRDWAEHRIDMSGTASFSAAPPDDHLFAAPALYGLPPVPGSSRIEQKLDHILHLLEDQQDMRTETKSEDIILYACLGIFIVYVVDACMRRSPLRYIR